MIGVIFADDDLLIHNKLNMMLSEIPDCVLLGSATNGEEAIALLQSKKPDLLIVDIEMSEPNGIEITRYIKKYNIPTEVLVLSNFDAFEYVRTVMQEGAVDYVLKHQLNTTLLRKKLQVIETKRDDNIIKRHFSFYAKQQFLLKCLTDNIEDSDENKLLAREKEFNASCYAVVYMQIANFMMLFEKGDALIQQAMNITNSILLNFDNGICVHLKNGGFAILLRETSYVGHAKMTTGIKKIMLLIESNLTRILNLEVLYEYEIFIDKVSNIGKYSRLAMTKLDGKILNAHTQADERESFSINIHDERALINALCRADSTEVQNLLTKILGSAMSFGVAGVIEGALETYRLCARFRDQFGPPGNAKLMHSVFPKLKGKDFVKEAITCLYSFCIRIIERSYQNDSQKAYSDHIANAMHYIRLNYTIDISLDSIAEFLGLSNVYFSHLFKQETGITFSSYLNKYRIDMAKDILTFTNHSLMETAEKTGFRNYNYFIQKFRKEVGVTPHKFRQAISKYDDRKPD